MSIVQGKRVFIQLASIGQCDDKGKAVFSKGFKGKVIAEPDRPLSMLAVGLIEELITFARYSSTDAIKDDLAGLSAYVASLEKRTTTGPSSEPETEA